MVYMSLSCTLRGSFYKGKTDILLFTLEIFTVENQANILIAFSKRYRGRYPKHRENTLLRTVCLSHTHVYFYTAQGWRKQNNRSYFCVDTIDLLLSVRPAAP